jgi:peptidyl-prolyl cis-trans isomerase SurA
MRMGMGKAPVRPSWIVAAVFLPLLLTAPPARASRGGGEVIERVVAVVNDQAILLSDLRQRAVPFLPQVMASAQSETQRLAHLDRLYKELLEHLIEEQLFEQAARKHGVRVTDGDVERAIGNVQRSTGLQGNDFWEAVREQGLTQAEYKRDLRRQLLRLKLINERVRGRVNISEQDVRARYEEHLRKANRQLRFRASHCFFAVAPDATATHVAAVRQQAHEAAKGLTGDSFEQCVDAHGGGDLGWLSRGDLPAELEQVLLTLQAGELSAPARGPAGYHVFLVHERELGSANIPPYEEAKEHIFREMLDVAMSRQEKVFVEELQKQAVIRRRL